jgi:hypothetical protein
MFHPCIAIVASMIRRAAPTAFVVTCLWAALAQSQPPDGSKDDRPAAAPDSVEVFGKVVDAETGKPVEAFITQAGKFDPKDPKNVTWGFSETRNTSGGFSATIKWNEGWTARILADGYVPQPVLSEAPPSGKDRIEKVIRLKKGRIVRGRVLDHLGKPVKEVVAEVDTVSFCLSKALGAPVGSMIAGSEEHMRRGRLYRKRLGGGMRQAGVLAAAGLIALEEHPRKLAADHANARFLAEALAKIPGIALDPGKIQTNIVIYDVSGTGLTAAEFSARLKAKGVLMNAVNETNLRAVTHYDVNREGVELALRAVGEVSSTGVRTQAV